MPEKEGRTGRPGNSTTYHPIQIAVSNVDKLQPGASRPRGSAARTGNAGNDGVGSTGRADKPGNDASSRSIEIATSNPGMLQPANVKKSSPASAGGAVPSWTKGKFNQGDKGLMKK